MMQKLSQDVVYVGVNDHESNLFEGQFAVPNGMAYNSYVILDEKIAVLDSVEANFTRQWLDNVAEALDGRQPDYLVVSHMEPDHSANIANFVKAYPNVRLVGNAKTFIMLAAYFGTDFAVQRVEVRNGDKLSLGKHELTFVFAPMVHWPEVMMTYDNWDGTLYSADAFGKFGALDVEEKWEDEARRYYFGIVGKYGVQVQAVLGKLAPLNVRRICPLHGPVLKENLGHYIDLYGKWSSYTPEVEGVMIAYVSVYGHTAQAAELLYRELKARGVEQVTLCDLTRCDHSVAVATAFAFDKLALACTTYNGDVFPAMRQFLDELAERNYRNRTVGLIENGSWAPFAVKAMKARLEKCKDITFAETEVTVRSSLNEQSEAQVRALACELGGCLDKTQ